MSRRGVGIDPARLGQARTAKRLTQDDLAELVGAHRVTIAKLEGTTGPACSLELLERLSAALGRSREWLMGEPEQVDEFELARNRMASAMSQIADGFEDFTEAVEALQRRAHEAATSEEVTAA